MARSVQKVFHHWYKVKCGVIVCSRHSPARGLTFSATFSYYRTTTLLFDRSSSPGNEDQDILHSSIVCEEWYPPICGCAWAFSIDHRSLSPHAALPICSTAGWSKYNSEDISALFISVVPIMWYIIPVIYYIIIHV